MGRLYEQGRERSLSLPGKETFLFTFKKRVRALSLSQSFCHSLSLREATFLSFAQRGGDLSVSLKGRQRAPSPSLGESERALFLSMRQRYLSLSLPPFGLAERERECSLSVTQRQGPLTLLLLDRDSGPSLSQRTKALSPSVSKRL